MIKNKNSVIVICGPTASGKSELAFQLAKEIDAEIVSADSMQIYQDMNIGTAKVTSEIRAEVPHHMLDIISPLEKYSVANYSRDATKVIKELLIQEKRVILCGGTGLYINSLLDGLVFIDIPVNDTLRKQIKTEITNDNRLEWHDKIKQLDPKSGQRIESKDLRRIRRFFEVYQSTNLTQTQINKKSRKKGPDFDFENFYLKPDRQILYEKINKRTEKMFEEGLIEEVRGLVDKYPGIKEAQSFQAIGYKETIAYLEGKKSFEDIIDRISQVTRNYAKRQFTWFNARTDLNSINKLSSQEALKQILKELYS